MIDFKKINFGLLFALIFFNFNQCREYEYFPDMAYSPAVDAQQEDEIGKRKGNFLPPENTIPYKKYPYKLKNSLEDYPKADIILKSPYKKIGQELLQRGKMQYDIYCSPCHGLQGKGDGSIKKKWAGILPLVEVEGKKPPPLDWGVGRISHVIRVGIRSMQGYASQIKEENIWAISHYVKYLQRNSKK